MELIGASTGRAVCFKAALAEERKSSVDFAFDPGNRTGGMYEFDDGRGGGGGGGGGIIVCPGCTLGRRWSDALRRSSWRVSANVQHHRVDTYLSSQLSDFLFQNSNSFLVPVTFEFNSFSILNCGIILESLLGSFL